MCAVVRAEKAKYEPPEHLVKMSERLIGKQEEGSEVEGNGEASATERRQSGASEA